MNRAVSGTLSVLETGRPLPGLFVITARLLPGGHEVLGAAVSGDFGRFRVAYPPLEAPCDLTLLVVSPSGRLIFTEPVHRAIAGAELSLRVEVPGEVLNQLGQGLPE